MGRKATVALISGALVLTLAMGIRQTFGLFLSPMSIDLGFGRESFGLAMAIQNILWGVVQPVTGMIADKYGAGRVLVVGTAAYVAGLVIMSGATGVWGLHLGGGVLVGLAMSCTSFAVVLGAIGRAVPAEKRSMALGIASAGGSFGQFVMAPIGQGLIAAEGWGRSLGRHGAYCGFDGAPGPGFGGASRRTRIRRERRRSRRAWARPSAKRGVMAVFGTSPSAFSSAVSRWCSSPSTCRRTSPTSA